MTTARAPVTAEVKRKLARFYSGSACVLTGVRRASPHHLNGNRGQSDFPNLVPLTLDLHNGLRFSLAEDNLRSVLKGAALENTAKEHFRHGRMPHAFACLRLS